MNENTVFSLAKLYRNFSSNRKSKLKNKPKSFASKEMKRRSAEVDKKKLPIN